MGLAKISDLRRFDLAFRQVQGNVGLPNMPDPRHVDLVKHGSSKHIKPNIFGHGRQPSLRQCETSKHVKPKKFGLDG